MPDLAIPDGYALTPPPAGATAPAGAPPPTGGAQPPAAAIGAEVSGEKGPTAGATPVAPTPPPAAVPPPPPPAPAPAVKTLAQLEADANARVDAYAAQNNLDDDMTQQLRGQTLSRVRGQYNVSEEARRSAYHSDITLARAEALAGGPNGEGFHSIDAYLADPDRHARYDRLTPADQLVLAEHIAKNPVPATPERVQRFSELRGMAISSPAEFLNIDPLKEDLPLSMQKSLVGLHDQVFKSAQVDFDTTKAMSTIENLGYLQDTGIDKKNNPQLYHQFVGALSDAGNQFKAENKRPPNTEEVRKMATDLLKVVIPGASWNPFSSDTRQFETIVPNADRADIVRAYSTQFNRNPTPAQIMQIYHYQLDHPSATATIPPPQ